MALPINKYFKYKWIKFSIKTHGAVVWIKKKRVKLHASFKRLDLALRTHIAQTSWVVPWLRIRLPVQGTWGNPWFGRIPHASGQVSPLATSAEPLHRSYWTLNAWETVEVLCSTRSLAPQQEKLTRHNSRLAPLTQTRERPHTARKIQPAINKKANK